MEAFFKRLPPKKLNDEQGRIQADDRPTKRLKQDESDDSNDEGSDVGHNSIVGERPKTPLLQIEDSEAEDDLFLPRKPDRSTEIENVVPLTVADEAAALEEYDTIKSSQQSVADDQTTAKPRPMWLRGRSSVYVDAFNLALDTVLDEESHLFNEKEMTVFARWREMDYEAQYLYVRLFLRKQALWHRHSRLRYHSDISDLEQAVVTLQRSQPLPGNPPTSSAQSGLQRDIDEIDLDNDFTFADSSATDLTSIEEAASLLLLDELKSLTKEAKVQGRNKGELVRNLARTSHDQAGLMSMGLSRQNSTASGTSTSEDVDLTSAKSRAILRRQDSNREQYFMDKIMAILGPCVRLSPPIFQLFERVHLVFYRSTEWTEKSLSTIILSKIARRNFPEYIVCRTATIFPSRSRLLEFEASIRLEAEVDNILEFNGPPGAQGYQRIVDIFEALYPRWRELVQEEREKEQSQYEMGEGAYLRRFTPAHSYTRIIHKALDVLARRKEHVREHDLLSELLEQHLFHMARRGAWYQRKALIEEHYMPQVDEHPETTDMDLQKKHWKKIAAKTCEDALQDPDCHLMFHYDLQKRLTKLEKKLRIPKRLQHDFGHVRLAAPTELTVEGIQLKRELAVKPGRVAASTKTIWFDELDSGGECSVEEMCLSHFRSIRWKGYHSEGGIMRTIFAYLFFDILFLYIPNVFQTAFQACPLDLHTDAFFPTRYSEINHRLVEIANGEGERILREVWEKHHERRTSVVGLQWDFEIEDLAELVRCFEGSALSAVCKVMAQEYKQRGGGMPDLILWKPDSEQDGARDAANAPGMARGEVMFVEVKSANDRLSDTQRLWIHVLTGAGVKVALCNAVAKEVREVD